MEADLISGLAPEQLAGRYVGPLGTATVFCKKGELLVQMGTAETGNLRGVKFISTSSGIYRAEMVGAAVSGRTGMSVGFFSDKHSGQPSLMIGPGAHRWTGPC